MRLFEKRTAYEDYTWHEVNWQHDTWDLPVCGFAFKEIILLDLERLKSELSLECHEEQQGFLLVHAAGDEEEA